MTEFDDSTAAPRTDPAWTHKNRARPRSGLLSSFIFSLTVHAGFVVAGVLFIPRIQPRIDLGGGGGGNGLPFTFVQASDSTTVTGRSEPAPPMTAPPESAPDLFEFDAAKAPGEIPAVVDVPMLAMSGEAGTESTADVPAFSSDWGPRSAPPSARTPPWSTANSDSAHNGANSGSPSDSTTSATRPAPYTAAPANAGDGGSGPGAGGGFGGGLPRAAGANPMPQYPEAARRRGLEGTVLLRFTIRTDGIVENLEIHQSSGSEQLDTAAATAVRRWRFDAASIPRAITVIKPIVFRLDEH